MNAKLAQLASEAGRIIGQQVVFEEKARRTLPAVEARSVQPQQATTHKLDFGAALANHYKVSVAGQV